FIPEFLSEGASGKRSIVGCIFKTYWIFEYEGKVYVLDQHAAHEKVLFERFMRAYEDRQIISEPLMPPMIVTLSAKEEALLEANMAAFEELGFEIEHFGERDYAVRAVPYTLGSIDSAVLFREFLVQLDTTPDLRDMKLYIHTVATEACRAAVKGGGRMSYAEAEALIDELMRCEDPYHCPHGRPTIMSFARRDVEKLFKRIV
ncbi:MAG: DNA mismatch repair protein MutL, partial [Lachnospiraceae bacterium]|nr:DNA mismatch repair protein MutL [Lachnospiraceae bacterium]